MKSGEPSGEIYKRAPHSVVDEIPIFSRTDEYVENYKKIARDHVSSIAINQENPFMEEQLWVSLEASTREFVRKYVPAGSKILDVGVGLGRLLEPLTEYDRYGVDISLDYLQAAKQRGINVALSKIEELPYSDGFFDAIVTCDVLEHVFDLNYCSEKILSCLKPGGILIVRVPYKEDLNVYLNKDLPYEFIHMRNFDEASLRLHFEKIFSLKCLGSSTTTPYLQGTPRLKLRLLPEGSRKKMVDISEQCEQLKSVRAAFEVSEEAFQSWIYGLKTNSKELFDEVIDHLILGIEINFAFEKPYVETQSRRNLRSGTVDAQVDLVKANDQGLARLGDDFSTFRLQIQQAFEEAKLNLAELKRDVACAFDADGPIQGFGRSIDSLSEFSKVENAMLKDKISQLVNDASNTSHKIAALEYQIEVMSHQMADVARVLSILAMPLQERLARKIKKIFLQSSN